MSEDAHGGGTSSKSHKSSGTKRGRRRVVWDEDNLAHLEETKTPKQKIDEPKTPYHPSTAYAEDGLSPMNLPSDNEGVDPEEVRTALDEVAAKRGKGGWTSSEDDEGDTVEFEKWMEDRATASATADGKEGASVSFQEPQDYYGSNSKDKAFKEHRKRHYDEFRRLKQLRSQDKRFLDGDVEDNDRDDGGGRNLSGNHSEGYSGGAESDGDKKTGCKGGILKADHRPVAMDSEQPSSDEGNHVSKQGGKVDME